MFSSCPVKFMEILNLHKIIRKGFCLPAHADLFFKVKVVLSLTADGSVKFVFSNFTVIKFRHDVNERRIE